MSTKIVAARLATSAGVTTVITRSSTPGNLVQILAHIQATQGSSLLQKSSSFASLPSAATTAASAAAPSLSGSTTLTKPPLHTRFLPWPEPIRDRSFWILHGLAPHGTVFIDQGAYQALVERAGLLPVGVVDVEGPFSEHDAVRIVVVDRKPAATTDGCSGAATTTPAITTPSLVTSGTEVGRALVKYSSTEIARIKGHRSRDIQGILGYVTSEYVAQREYISLFRRKDSRPASPSLRDKERDVAHHHRVSPNQKAATVAVESPLHKVEGLALNTEPSSKDEPSA